MDLVGEPLYDNEPSGAEARKSAQRAARSLAARVAKLHGAVPLPVAAQELLTLTATEEFEVPKVVRVIEADPALTGRLIRQVNTALAGRARCASVTQAVTLLGVRMLRASALAASALELFASDEEPRARRVVEHAVRTGTVARFLAPHAGLAPDEMYTAGLLVDVGKLMLLRGKDREYLALLDSVADEDLHAEERKRLGYDHALVAGHVLAAWKLPHPLPRVVAWHHQPFRAFRAAGQVPRMVALVRVADRLAALDAEATADDAARALAKLEEEIHVLGFAEDALPKLCAGVVRELAPEAERDAAPEPSPAPPEPRPEPASPRAPASTRDEAPSRVPGRASRTPSAASQPASAEPAPAAAKAPTAPPAKAPAEPAAARAPVAPDAPAPAAPGLAVASVLVAGGALLGRLSSELVPADVPFFVGLLAVPVVLWVFGAAHGAVRRARA